MKPGQKLRLVVDASNAGPSPTGRFKVHVQLPQGVVPSEPADGYDKATGEWSIGQMQAGGRASLTLPVTVPADETRLTFKADIDPDSYRDLNEIDSKNNVSQVSVEQGGCKFRGRASRSVLWRVGVVRGAGAGFVIIWVSTPVDHEVARACCHIFSRPGCACEAGSAGR
ncbi:DUF11 domain-containing protein [Streptomyces sp. NBC_01264]|nr:hypothetical protein [Streptomyces sp. NBC_01264]MCX4775270.1 DUF11 domain-containing protein [Streptomyces sp. NBC_01264]